MLHTKGPWTVRDIATADRYIGPAYDGGGPSIAIVRSPGRSDAEVTANARLIAAAPRMAHALQWAARLLATSDDTSALMLALRTEIVECIKRATPDHYGLRPEPNEEA